MNYLLEGVGKEYVVRRETVYALESVSLSVRKGEVMVILGSSVAGKTTLFRLLNVTQSPPAVSAWSAGRCRKRYVVS
jgi:ABC-type methionine transport system ATPase subunit